MGNEQNAIENVPQGTKRPVGRPSKFNELLRTKIIELTTQGKTLAQISEILGINKSTLLLWCNEKQELSISVREARAIADELVEASLFKRAVGYEHEVQKINFFEGHSSVEVITEKFPPDTKAAQFWLSNRDPNRWKEKQTIEHSGVIQTESELSNLLKDPEAARLAMELAKVMSSKKNELKP